MSIVPSTPDAFVSVLLPLFVIVQSPLRASSLNAPLLTAVVPPAGSVNVSPLSMVVPDPS